MVLVIYRSNCECKFSYPDFTWSVSSGSNSGRSVRGEKRKDLFRQSTMAVIFRSALGLVHHWRCVLSDLFLHHLSNSQTQRRFNAQASSCWADLVYDGRQWPLELRFLSCSEFVHCFYRSHLSSNLGSCSLYLLDSVGHSCGVVINSVLAIPGLCRLVGLRPLEA